MTFVKVLGYWQFESIGLDKLVGLRVTLMSLTIDFEDVIDWLLTLRMSLTDYWHWESHWLLLTLRKSLTDYWHLGSHWLLLTLRKSLTDYWPWGCHWSRSPPSPSGPSPRSGWRCTAGGGSSYRAAGSIAPNRHIIKIIYHLHCVLSFIK